MLQIFLKFANFYDMWKIQIFGMLQKCNTPKHVSMTIWCDSSMSRSPLHPQPHQPHLNLPHPNLPHPCLPPPLQCVTLPRWPGAMKWTMTVMAVWTKRTATAQVKRGWKYDEFGDEWWKKYISVNEWWKYELSNIEWWTDMWYIRWRVMKIYEVSGNVWWKYDISGNKWWTKHVLGI